MVFLWSHTAGYGFRMNIPNKPVYLSAPANLSDLNAEGVPLHFSGVPYSGAVMTDWGMPFVIDLSTTTATQKMPLLKEHERECVIGVVTECAITTEIRASGDIFSDIDDDAQEIALKAKRGIEWQMSVGLFDATHEDVPAGKSIECNGIMIQGPVVVLRHGVVREVSIVALGADKQTSADFFTAPQGTNPNEDTMSDNAEILALKAQVDELGVKLKAAEDRATEAENKAKEVLLSARKLEVTALFAELGKEATDESVAVYLSMGDDAWTAIAKDLKALASADREDRSHLFSEQATGEPGGRQPQKPVLNTAEIYAARRAN